MPPEPILRGFLEAAYKLRDAVDTACATFDPKDEFVLLVEPGITALDWQISVLHDWLAERPQDALAAGDVSNEGGKE